MQDSNFHNRGSNTGFRSQGGGSRSRVNDASKEDRLSIDDFMKENPFHKDWILCGADEKMVSFAEKAGKYMAPQNGNENDKQKLSKSQIRNVFGEIKRIQLKGYNTSEGKSSFMLLKPKVAYAEGRNKTKGLSLFKRIFDEGWNVVANNNATNVQYGNFCALLEAILAYHKAFGGKD